MTLDELSVKVDAATGGLESGMDRATEAMEDLSDKVDRLADELEVLDRKEVDIDVDKSIRSVANLSSASGILAGRVSSIVSTLGRLAKVAPAVFGTLAVGAGAVVTVTAGMVAATAATGALTAAMGGLVGAAGAAGIAAAAMSEEVKSAFSGLKSTVKTALLVLTEPIQNVLVDLADRLGNVFAGIAPGLQAVFADIASYIDVFADALLPVVDRVMPSFVRLVDSARPVVEAFAGGLASLGPHIVRAMNEMMQAGPAIASMVDSVFASFGELLTYTTDLFSDLAKIGKPLVKSFLSTFEAIIKGVGETLKALTILANVTMAGAVKGPGVFAKNLAILYADAEQKAGGATDATNEFSEALQNILDKLRSGSFGGGGVLSKVQKVMQGLEEQIGSIELSGQLATERGEYDRIGQLQSRLQAVGDAWKEVASSEGMASEAARKLYGRYIKILDIIQQVKKARATRRVEGLGPVEVSPESSSLTDFDYSTTGDKLLDQMNRAVEGMKTKWQKASAAIGKITESALVSAVDSASRRFGQQFSGALMSLFRGPDEMRMASLEERKLSLKDQLTGLRESLRQGELSHAMYSAKVKSIHAELAETNKQLAYETAGFFEKTFRSIGNLVESVIQQVIASISAAIARAAILATIQVALGTATGGWGGAFIGALSGATGAATNVAVPLPVRPATMASTGGLTVTLQGEFVQRGQDLVATVNTTQRANTRRGRS